MFDIDKSVNGDFTSKVSKCHVSPARLILQRPTAAQAYFQP